MHLSIINWNDPSQVYFAGDVITGVVVIVNTSQEPQRLRRAVAIVFAGEGTVKWIETDVQGFVGYPQGERLYKKYEGKKTYLSRKLPLMVSSSSPNTEAPDDDGLIIHPGRHEYPFQFHLPSLLPSSYEGTHGRIFYYVDVDLIVIGSSRVRIRELFTVKAVVDLNVNLENRVPGLSYIQISGKNGTAGIRVHTPKRGYVTNEPIPLIMKVTNLTNYFLEIKFSFIKMENYRVENERPRLISCRKTLQEINGPSISPGKLKIWEHNEFILPSEVVVDIGITSLISVSYFLQIDVTATGKLLRYFPMKSFVRTGRIPIKVGSIPIHEEFQNQYDATAPQFVVDEPELVVEGQPLGDYNTHGDMQQPSAPPISNDNFLTSDDLPPSYQEAMAITRRRSYAHSAASSSRRGSSYLQSSFDCPNYYDTL